MDSKDLNCATKTKENREGISPEDAERMLREGNDRFVYNKMCSRDLKDQREYTSKEGQHPFATILHCIDSRVSAELIFDQGIGDVFSVRIAGNFVNSDILGSMEFATHPGEGLGGTKIIVVLGHTACGAVKGSIDDVQIGNLGAMVGKIRPAVNAITEPKKAEDRTSDNGNFVNAVARKNVELSVQRILNESTVIAGFVKAGHLKVVGAMYDISSGTVTFLNDEPVA